MDADELDVHRLSLIVLRLMDNDLLLPQEGEALLSEISGLEQARDEASTVQVQAIYARILYTVETLAQSDRIGGVTLGLMQEMMHQILHAAADPT